MLRMRLPQLFNDVDEFNLSPKSDDDQMMGRADEQTMKPSSAKPGRVGSLRVIDADLDWSPLMLHFSKTERSKLENAIAGTLLQTNRAVSADLVRRFADASDRESFIRSVTLQYMSTPEYQLC